MQLEKETETETERWHTPEYWNYDHFEITEKHANNHFQPTLNVILKTGNWKWTF